MVHRDPPIWLVLFGTLGVALFAVALIMFIARAAHGEPPAGADMSLAPWFRSLQVPGVGSSCCDMSDCRMTDWRSIGDRYETLTSDGWQVVPAEVVLHRHDNPTGRAVVCYLPGRGILCFVPGPET
jgi:hypothetical protein